jgi:hypothetical protein
LELALGASPTPGDQRLEALLDRRMGVERQKLALPRIAWLSCLLVRLISVLGAAPVELRANK